MWGAEDIANQLVDCILFYHEKNYVHPEIVSILSNAGFEHCPLYKCLVDDLTYFVVKGEYRCWDDVYQDQVNTEYQPGEVFTTACN